MKHIKIIGHRGAASLAPENTIPSFEAALQLGVDGIETDIQRSADGKLVLFHDDFLERTTNGKGMLQEQTWKKLQQLDAGSWFDKRFSGTTIPLLNTILQHYGTQTTWDLEIKQPGIEDEVIKAVEPYNLFDKIVFTSFHFLTVCNVKQKYPQLRTGFLTDDFSETMIKKIRDNKIEQFCPKANLITRAMVHKWKNMGFFVRAWGVSDTTIMDQAIKAEVDGMTVDFPDLLLKKLDRI